MIVDYRFFTLPALTALANAGAAAAFWAVIQRLASPSPSSVSFDPNPFFTPLDYVILTVKLNPWPLLVVWLTATTALFPTNFCRRIYARPISLIGAISFVSCLAFLKYGMD
jgi:hypothetical protein